MNRRDLSLRLGRLACLVILTGGCAAATVGGDLDEVGTEGKSDGHDGRLPAIYNGVPDSGHHSVGMLRIGGNGTCTATLVGKRTVLTAAHCTKDYLFPGAYTVFFNNTPYAVLARIPHPHFTWAADGKLDANKHALSDISVLLLAQAPPVQPTPVAAVAPQVGQSLTLVGFGHTDVGKNDLGVKRMAPTKVEHVHGRFIAYGSKKFNNGSIRPGDSGGPAFLSAGGQLAQIGVASMFYSSGAGISCRVDQHINWLKQVSGGDLLVLGQPGGQGQPGPNQGQGYGQSCSAHNQCASHLCATFGGFNYCTHSCNPSSFSACPGGAGCFPSSSGLWICGPPLGGGAPPPPPPPPPPPKNNTGGGYGQPCTSTQDCQSQVCISQNGKSMCSKTCSNSGGCPSGHTCHTTFGFGFCGP